MLLNICFIWKTINFLGFISCYSTSNHKSTVCLLRHQKTPIDMKTDIILVAPGEAIIPSLFAFLPWPFIELSKKWYMHGLKLFFSYWSVTEEQHNPLFELCPHAVPNDLCAYKLSPFSRPFLCSSSSPSTHAYYQTEKSDRTPICQAPAQSHSF